MYERRHEPLASRQDFLRRLTRNAGFALVIFSGSLAVGILGYHFLIGLSWIDALLNASMILGGMGPLDPVQTDAGKIFASFYALYSGLIVLAVAGLIFAPVFHRFLHYFHASLDEGDDEGKPSQ
jgi:hypothetical protein